METLCELCSIAVDDSATHQCPTCEVDGLCSGCLKDHDCKKFMDKQEDRDRW